MAPDLSAQAESLKEHIKEETATALSWIESGSVRDDSAFKDPDGHSPFKGCMERLEQRTKEMELVGEHWDQATLALWCKREADTWFDGFPDDSQSNRRDFAASLCSLAQNHLELIARTERVVDEPYLTATAIDNAAIEKACMPEGWLPYRYVKGDGEIEITGCMTRPKKSGPNKGRPKYLRHEGERTVVVTAQDVERHKRALLEQHPS